ncbi:MAG: glycosyltransferase family 2 protein [Nitrospirae bacterium]|nr:glycosyltransferase family 2 protein [Nitrospirota bacterium]
MLNGKKIIVVLPAYRAEKTLLQTYQDIPRDIVDTIILVDDASDDSTVELAKQLGIEIFVHGQNMGYGANQKTCYREALRAGADIVVMLHPDYQYDPRLIIPMAGMVASGIYDVVLGSRILGGGAMKGGMPFYKYLSNRFLTYVQNLLMATKLSEFHSGYRAFTRKVLESLPLLANSDDYIFDNQMLAQTVAQEFRIGEISCPTRYFPEASSINLNRSVVYGLGVLQTSVTYFFWKLHLLKSSLFDTSPTKCLNRPYYSRPATSLLAESSKSSESKGDQGPKI